MNEIQGEDASDNISAANGENNSRSTSELGRIIAEVMSNHGLKPLPDKVDDEPILVVETEEIVKEKHVDPIPIHPKPLRKRFLGK